MKISGGIKEDGIVVGNAYDKYGSRNPIVKAIMAGFENSLSALVSKIAPATINEIGCGEGYWVVDWQRHNIDARGCDFSTKVIELAQSNARAQSMEPDIFSVRSIYDVTKEEDSADLVVCCEVLEHLEDPRAALDALRRIVSSHIVLSVPREPIWRALNFCRGKYIGDLGNTPGHIQHWSKSGFLALVGEYFDVLEVRTPLPWVMVLCRAKNL